MISTHLKSTCLNAILSVICSHTTAALAKDLGESHTVSFLFFVLTPHRNDTVGFVSVLKCIEFFFFFYWLPFKDSVEITMRQWLR